MRTIPVALVEKTMQTAMQENVNMNNPAVTAKPRGMTTVSKSNTIKRALLDNIV